MCDLNTCESGGHQGGSGRGLPETSDIVEERAVTLWPRLAGTFLATMAVVAICLFLWVGGRHPGWVLLVILMLLYVGLVANGCSRRRGIVRDAPVVLALSLLSGVMPMMVLGMFTTVFVIGKASTVVQLADRSGFDYWGLWSGFWPLMLFCTPLGALPALAALFMALCKDSDVKGAFALPISALLCSGIAFFLVLGYFPSV